MKTDIEVTRKSAISGIVRTATFKMEVGDWEKYTSGEHLIQDVLWYLTADEREFILSGITPEEWKAAFGNGEEE